MRYILIILVFLSVGAKAQMVIKAHANYRPLVQPAANLLLDDYPNAAAAYSLRKLDKDYTGAAIRVRKDTTGQPEQDIFFVGNELDTVGLKNFAQTRSCFIVYFYDQSTNSRDLGQLTAANQPRIVNLGTIERQNGDVCAFFDGSNDFMAIGSSLFGSVKAQPNTFFITLRTSTATATGNGYVLYDNIVGTNRTVLYYNGTTFNNRYMDAGAGLTATGAASSNTNYLWTNYYNSTSSKFFQNGTEIASGNAGTNGVGGIRISANFLGNGMFNGYLFEFIYYNSDQSSNRTGIQSNINTYYGIY